MNLLNLVSPGAGFAVIVRNSAVGSCRIGLLTGLGIVASSFLHKSYTFLGFGLLISQNEMLFTFVKYAGCIHLAYLGLKCLWEGLGKKEELPRCTLPVPGRGATPSLKGYQGFRMGFLTDLLNPQASLCFMSLVAATVSPATPLKVQLFYGFILLGTSVIWYSCVALFFSSSKLQKYFLSLRRIFESMMGGSMLYLSFRLLSLSTKAG
tara:strand:+ start:63 stop:686 length:624 start_codon:yes stop_codon:yes gene_type:complete